MSALHFFFSVSVLGGAIALGDAGQHLSRPHQVALWTLTFPILQLMEAGARVIMPIGEKIGDVVTFLGLFAINSLGWGAVLTIAMRWSARRLRLENWDTTRGG